MTLPATHTNRDVLLTASSEAARSDATSLMEAIVRLTTSPQFNPEGIERMMAMYERMADREAQVAFNEAMSAAQEEMRPVARDAQGEKSKYASYAALDTALRPIYTKHDLSLSFNTAASEHENNIRVLCYVTRGGYTREYSLDMPADGKGPRGGEMQNRTHATASAVTYGMRYLLKMIFNVAVEQDDDGKAAGRTRPAPPRPPTESKFITPAQVDELCALLDRSPERVRQFRRVCLDGASLEDISASSFGAYKERILDANAKRARQATQLPAEPFRERTVPSMPPKLKGAPAGNPDNFPRSNYRVDPDTGEVTEPPGATHSSVSDLPWEDQINDLVDDKPPAIANINILMKWQARCFELMPDKETAAEFHWEHIHADGPSRWLRDIPHPANADALLGAWNLLMKRFD